ncbi:MAG TPA: hypothetical protein VF766_05950 [Pyrinomonadaceae bacterium]
MINLKDKIIPVALVAALLGGSVGAIVSRKNPEPAQATYSTPSANLFDGQNTQDVADRDNSRIIDNNDLASKVEDAASYRVGFLDGFSAAERERNQATSNLVTERTVVPANRVVYRNAPVQRRSYSRASSSRQVYYDYNTQPRKRSFWQKHRDKLTVAMGAGGGALIGSLIGGKKGAAIGALAGGGGAAVYTYGIRKRNRRY